MVLILAVMAMVETRFQFLCNCLVNRTLIDTQSKNIRAGQRATLCDLP